MINPIKKLCITIGNLPESYFETLSYYESICWLLKFINTEIIPAINENAEAVKELQAILNEIEEYIQNYENDIETLNNKIGNNTSSIAILQNELNTNTTNLQNQINEIVIGDIYVFNPLSGRNELIDNVINSLYQLHRDNALTCTEFDALELTATSFDAYEITASEFDLSSETILV